MIVPGGSQRSESSVLGDPAEADWIAELADRIAAGEEIDLDAYAREHPERAETLRRYRRTIEVMAELGRSVARGEVATPRAGPVAELGTLGDFRLIREVGRGGMGIVYEAEQLSLRRRVALKIQPFAAALDPRLLQRFQVEAQAAALLHHAHIVPVHAVGTDRGIPYYAMTFIDGRTLADVIREFRRIAQSDRVAHVPSTRQVATTQAGSEAADFTLWGEPQADPCEAAPKPPGAGTTGRSDGRSHAARSHVRTAVTLALLAAEALDHAHESGVTHRDIKPANLMVDARGHLWVTDFGLARPHGAGELTRSGDVVGTLRYMSPEQARGRGTVVDHRTDIYSLGATLYELHTLAPAVCGGDRLEILHGIVKAEPRPPRKLNPAIPVDLETVVLKALDKEPGRRNATAREMAEDLRRVLEDKLIRAGPPSPLERLERWGRRHRLVVLTAAAGLLLATLGLGVGLAVVAHERDESRRQARRAEEYFDRVLEVVDELPGRVGRDRLLNEPGFQPLRRDLLRTAVSYLRKFASEQRDAPRIRAPLAESLIRVAVISQQLGADDEALGSCRDAYQIYEELTRAFPDAAEYRAGLVRTDIRLASLLRGRGDFRNAEEWARRALSASENLIAAEPRNAEFQALLAEELTVLSHLARDLGDTRAAREAAERGIRAWRALATSHPEAPEHETQLAGACLSPGLVEEEEGDRSKADLLVEEAVRRSERLVAAHPKVERFRYEKAERWIAEGHSWRGRLDEIRKEEARKIASPP